MQTTLHKNARTTPAMRAEIASSPLSVTDLARKFGVTAKTIRKWKNRSSTADASHRPLHLHATLTPEQEALVVHLRKTLLLPLDDLLTITRKLICPKVSRSGLDRCLHRYGLGKLKTIKSKLAVKADKDYTPGHFQIDIQSLPAITGQEPCNHLLLAIDRATHWVFAAFMQARSTADAKNFLKELQIACPMNIVKILVGNKEFGNPLLQSEAAENLAFEQLCAALGIVQHPDGTNHNIAAPFNHQLADIFKTRHFDSSESMLQTILSDIHLYNTQLPQAALKHKTPAQAMQDWCDTHPFTSIY